MDEVLKEAYLKAFVETDGTDEEKEASAYQAMVNAAKNSTWGEKPTEVQGTLGKNTYLYKDSQKMRNGKNKVIGKYSQNIKKGKTVSIEGITTDSTGREVFAVKYGEDSGYIYASNVEGNENIYKKFKIYDALQKLPSYASGGDIDFTGLAMVHGSKNNPENILSAEHTKLLRQGIFSNSNHSLAATVKAFQELAKNMASFGGEANSGIIIEHATVNIQPGVISNDYDARRAGEMALEEMVKIARKTTNRVVSR